MIRSVFMIILACLCVMELSGELKDLKENKTVNLTDGD